jgi:hypothetical protein
MNTALIVEPRDMKRIPLILNHVLFTLGSNWKIVFYCGLGLKAKWISIVNKEIEIRELPVNNFTACTYSDFLKSKELWNSLYGDFVLVFQTDAWIINEPPYTIDYFLSRNKSYIGGNMCYKWCVLEFKTSYSNYNGGLSLRKRKDMLYIIEKFPPVKTLENPPENIKIEDSPPIEALAEDAYFVKGCYLLNLDLGNTDEHFNHFALHTIFYQSAFGVHKPSWFVKQELIKLHPEIQTAYV